MAQTIAEIVKRMTPPPPSGQPGMTSMIVQNILQAANQIGTLTVAVVSLPLQREIKKLEFVLWYRMVYEHLVWLKKQQGPIGKGIDEAYADARDRVLALQAQAPDIRKAFTTIFATAGLDAAVAYRKAIRSQMSDSFWWALADS